MNILDSSKDDYIELPEIVDILSNLRNSEEDYYESLQISSDFQMHLERRPNSSFVNNYFEEGVLWHGRQTLISNQFLINIRLLHTCMCAYFSKSEDETSESMKQAAKEAPEQIVIVIIR